MTLLLEGAAGLCPGLTFPWWMQILVFLAPAGAAGRAGAGTVCRDIPDTNVPSPGVAPRWGCPQSWHRDLSSLLALAQGKMGILEEAAAILSWGMCYNHGITECFGLGKKTLQG